MAKTLAIPGAIYLFENIFPRLAHSWKGVIHPPMQKLSTFDQVQVLNSIRTIFYAAPAACCKLGPDIL
eukprot:1159065-Pelagomonas_calceolata.AAC.1